VPKRSELEHKALQSIANTGEEGLLQSELWRHMNATSREGSRIALKLENKGLIRRERELSEGRWTFRLFPNRKPASINSIINCPCLSCAESIRCGAYGANSPNDCEQLTVWLVDLIQQHNSVQGDS
jgi:hypothetical protein